jgi:predicted RNA-binding Zn ribbon-like protein
MEAQQRNEAPGDLELVRRFVNTRDVEEGTDELDGPDSLLDWFSGMNLLDDEAIADEEDLERALALREGIRSLLLAKSNGEVVEPANLRELNRVAGSVCLRVRFDEDGIATLGPESSGMSAALGRILAAVVRATDEGIWDRLKVCTNDACQWAFYDRSKNRSGKWCTMEVCGNRMKARTFRQRQGTGEG